VDDTLSASELVDSVLSRIVRRTAAGAVYGRAEDAPAHGPDVALEDVIRAEQSGETDALDLEE
jgi:hypothetical protein